MLHEQKELIPQKTHVRYRGELVELSVREAKIMLKRGHLKPVYHQAPLVIDEPELSLWRINVSVLQKNGGAI